MNNDWQDRVREEADELHDRLEALSIYMSGEAYASLDIVDQFLLSKQKGDMYAYLQTLEARVERFTL